MSHLLQQLEGLAPRARENPAREYLQVYVLRLLHERGAMANLAFVGGTALRLLYRLPRFSEDLDFSALPARGARSLSMEALFRGITSDLERAGYRMTVKGKQPRSVVQVWLRFDGLPAACGWNADPRVGLSLRVEADLHPPAGAHAETTLVQRFFPVALRHHDLPSLFAGKLHAILARPWAKGRDWYDLVWYLTERRGLEPNLEFLSNALAQTGHDEISAGQWRAAVLARMRSLDWAAVLADVRPFVERPSDLDLLARESVEKLLKGTLAES